MTRSVAALQRTCTLHALLAAHSPVAVVYRRGPSKQTCLILWNRTDDTFEVGQWFKGGVYPERSALAPDGARLLTFMGTFKPPFRTWTVLSRPPYFTALALWPTRLADLVRAAAVVADEWWAVVDDDDEG